jgi:hypothetical protein
MTVNVFLSLLQIVLALHTAVGAIWKSSNSERSVPSLAAIPHGVWAGLVGVEFLCAIALVVPIFEKRIAVLAPVGAALVGIEMLYFSCVHLASGSGTVGPVIYWLVVAAVCAFIIYGRLVLTPLRRGSVS